MTTETDKILVPEEQSGAPESTADTQETTPVAAQADEPATQETDGEEAPAAVDFTDEEAELAADAPEFDLGEEDESGNTEDVYLWIEELLDLVDEVEDHLQSVKWQGRR